MPLPTVLDAMVTPCYLGTNPEWYPCIAFSLRGSDGKAMPVKDAVLVMRKLITGTIASPDHPHFITAGWRIRGLLRFTPSQAFFRISTRKGVVLEGLAPITAKEESDFHKAAERVPALGVLITLRDDFSAGDAEADFRLRTELFTAAIPNIRIYPTMPSY